jgi:hypothetical protein
MKSIMSSTVVLAAVFVRFAAGQTQVDLSKQSKSVDFSSSQSTKPFQTGNTLPATCSVGQMFFVTSAPGGQNSYGCVAANTWALESGTAPPATTVRSSGTEVGTRSAVDFLTGPGVLEAISDTGQEIAVQSTLDTSYVETRPGEQSGVALLCQSASGSGAAYTCGASPALTTYTNGMVLHWTPDVDGAGGSTTIDVDLLGAKPLTLADGATNPGTSDIFAGQLYLIWYDGAEFRLISGSSSSGSGGTGPQGPRGATGPAGPEGPAGATGPSGPAGAGSGATLDFQSGTAAFTMNGSDVTIFSGSTPVTLEAGACLTFSAGATATGAASAATTLKVFADSTLIHTFYPSGGMPEYQTWGYCNLPGSSTNQLRFEITPLFFGGTSTSINSIDGYSNLPTPVTWGSTPHTLYLKANAVSGTVSGSFWFVR